VEEALDIALAQSMSTYDACYVALAHRLGLPLITADETLVHKLASTPYVVYSLASFPP
jgi:predicted nucleic acid-binding protein